MARVALLLCAAALALLVGGASAGASPGGCGAGSAPAWSPTGRWIAWGTGTGICFARPNGKHQQQLPLGILDRGYEIDPPYELVWAKPNLLVGLSNGRIYSIAFRPTPHLLSGEAFYGFAGDTFSLDAKADVLATASDGPQSGAPVTIMRAGGATTTVGDSVAVNADASLAPDGKHLVWSRYSSDHGGDVGPPKGIVKASVDGASVEGLTGGGGRPLWSPSGRKIAFEYGGLQVMTASGAHKTIVGHDCCMRADPQTIAWSPNSRLIAYVNNADRLAIVDVRTKRARTVKSIGVVDQLAWAPNSKELLVSAGRSLAELALWRVPVRNGKPRIIVGS